MNENREKKTIDSNKSEVSINLSREIIKSIVKTLVHSSDKFNLFYNSCAKNYKNIEFYNKISELLITKLNQQQIKIMQEKIKIYNTMIKNRFEYLQKTTDRDMQAMSLIIAATAAKKRSNLLNPLIKKHQEYLFNSLEEHEAKQQKDHEKQNPNSFSYIENLQIIINDYEKKHIQEEFNNIIIDLNKKLEVLKAKADRQLNPLYKELIYNNIKEIETKIKEIKKTDDYINLDSLENLSQTITENIYRKKITQNIQNKFIAFF